MIFVISFICKIFMEHKKTRTRAFQFHCITFSSGLEKLSFSLIYFGRLLVLSPLLSILASICRLKSIQPLRNAIENSLLARVPSHCVRSDMFSTWTIARLLYHIGKMEKKKTTIDCKANNHLNISRSR